MAEGGVAPFPTTTGVLSCYARKRLDVPKQARDIRYAARQMRIVIESQIEGVPDLPKGLAPPAWSGKTGNNYSPR